MSPETRGLLWVALLFVAVVLGCCWGLSMVGHHPLWQVRW